MGQREARSGSEMGMRVGCGGGGGDLMRRRVPSGSVSNRGRRRLEVRVDGGVGVGLVMVAVFWSGDEWDFVGNRFTWWFEVR